ncbi:MAG: HPr family phosphocarrier protein [Deltaproteobacteria bacterium]|nr:HPr family phosphocarrier protein [Deltaproteobacteria bacterium]MBW1870730.1 HPr family phosphocarrier protein [Deltaproteobacteria bacterium]
MGESRGKFEIKNKLGMHARAAAVFVKTALQYSSDIEVNKEDLKVSGKSIMSVLQLAAVQGDVIEVIALGDDSREALNAIGKLIAELFGEEE